MPRKPKLYTLSEVAKKTRISMSSLSRYKKHNQNRIPGVGEGRTQRYPKEAFAVFKQIKEENLARRGGLARTDVSNAALSERLARIETTLGHLTAQLQQLTSEVRRPVRVTIGG